MRAILYLNGKKARFWVNVGWFGGEPFALFKVGLFEKNEGFWTILSVQFLKLLFGFGVDLIVPPLAAE